MISSEIIHQFNGYIGLHLIHAINGHGSIQKQGHRYGTKAAPLPGFRDCQRISCLPVLVCRKTSPAPKNQKRRQDTTKLQPPIHDPIFPAAIFPDQLRFWCEKNVSLKKWKGDWKNLLSIFRKFMPYIKIFLAEIL